MPDAERARNVSTLNKIFALGSIALMVTVVWMVIDDYNREWKKVQRQFHQMEYDRTRAELRDAQNEDYKRQKATLDQELKAADDEIKKQQKAYEAALEKRQKLDTALYKANQALQFAKSRFSAARYEYETVASKSKVANDSGGPKPDPSVVSSKKDLDQKRAEMDAAEKASKEAESRYQESQKNVDNFLGRIEEINKKKLKLNEKVDRLSKKLDRVNPHDFSKLLLDAPLMDFMAPSLKVQQVVVPGVYNDLNFLQVPRVDRCTTCHLAVETKGYESEKTPHPFRTHPNLDLMVGAKSKHPVETFGCTACHQGRDRATAFDTAVHMPKSQQQAKEWEQKHRWHHYTHWDTPMLPGKYAESQCYKCHKNESYIPQADQLNRGRVLFERAGCYGCHKVQGLEGLRKAGPDLTHISSKVTPEWAFKWIKDPKGFRPTTRMPKFFDQTNTKSAEDLARNNVEVQSLVSYLFSVSEKIKYSPVTPSGNATRGKELVNSIGCLACHYVDTPATSVPADDRRMFGPTLDKLGSKTTATWVYNWVKNPKHYFPESSMPNLRLSDAEAMDITSYLMSLQDREFEQKQRPEVNTKVLDTLVGDYMKLTFSVQETQANMTSWSQEKKEVFLGERLITRYGCSGCHTIKGFEKAQNIGTELTEEGSKNIHQLDFGFINIPHTRHDWFYQKLKDPRIFDMMPDMVTTKVKAPEEKLKMPNFNFSDEEIRALVTFILGLTKEKIGPESTRHLLPKQVAIEEGRRLVKKFNCQGCHLLENIGGDIRKTITNVGLHPPILEGEGEMVKPEWLNAFLRAPTTIRPWLKVRMPTFSFSDSEVNQLTRYFSHLAEAEYPYQQYEYTVDPASIAAGKSLFDKGQCLKCHILNDKTPANDPENLAPDLGLARDRLRPQWIVKWMRDPQKIKPNTRMPTFFLDGNTLLDPSILGGKADPQMAAIKDYIVTLGRSGASGSGAGRSSVSGSAGKRTR